MSTEAQEIRWGHFLSVVIEIGYNNKENRRPRNLFRDHTAWIFHVMVFVINTFQDVSDISSNVEWKHMICFSQSSGPLARAHVVQCSLGLQQSPRI